jgi:geranylgeranyl reductase family protein
VGLNHQRAIDPVSVVVTADVFIVGAGPAGAYLAYLLAKQGVDVVIADKENFPRNKVCGGGLSRKTIELIDFDIEPVVQRHIRGAWLTYQNRDTIEAEIDAPAGCSVLRSEFDDLILRQAVGAGARFFPHCAFEGALRNNEAIRIQTSTGDVSAKYLIGADGVFSKVRKSFFPRDLVSYAPAIETLIPANDAVMADFGDRMLFDFGGMPRGYGWIFPKKDHLNVGVYSMFPRRSIRDDLSRFMSRYAALRGYDDVKILGHSIPTRNRERRYATDGVLLLGDAAGFAESFYGEGIYFALRSAVLAAEAFARAGGRRVEREYAERIRRHLAPDLFYSDLNARLFYPLQRFGYYRMARSKLCNYYFGELIGGRVGYRECFYKTLMTLPYWMVSERIPPSNHAPF